MKPEISAHDLNTWADFILNHSLGPIKSSDTVMVKGEAVTWPLMAVIQQKIIEAGAIADVNLVPPDNNRGQIWSAAMARFGTEKQISRIPEWHIDRYRNMTKYIEILGAENPALFSALPAKTASAVARADETCKNIRLSKPWVLTLFPTRAFAELENLDLQTYTDIVVSASTTDPSFLEKIEEPLFQAMNRAKTVTIRTAGPGDDKIFELTMNIARRFSVKCTGKRNFPDGEVFTSPNAGSVEGEIFVDLPVYYNGTTLQGIYLKFESGRIVSYSADRGMNALADIIETDEGSHRLGEVALGMNAGLKKALVHPLFIEKVGGTLHIAIGASYPECYVKDPGTEDAKKILDHEFAGGHLNRSAQHVDIVTDFRPGGAGREVWLDHRRLFVRDGIWHLEGE